MDLNEATESDKLEVNTTITESNNQTSNQTSNNKIRLEWNDINVYSPKKKKRPFSREKAVRTQVLNEVSGSMLAVMGSSGAGKTTLLNVLSDNYNRSFKVKGKITVNNSSVDMRKFSCFVEQFDMFHGRLTVKEHLEFYITLHFGENYSRKSRNQRLNEIVTDLNLVKCQNTRIGEPGRYEGISGGERRRLSVATEVIGRPKIVYLDEPTSGLDTNMAEMVVKSLKNLAKQNHLIICTIHQPSSQIFSNFDRIYLLADGKLIFTGTLPETDVFFDSAGYPCPEKYNPADHYINVLSINASTEDADRKRVMELREKYINSIAAKDEKNSDKGTDFEYESLSKKNSNKKKYSSSFFLQLYTLSVRVTKLTMREPYLFMMKLAQALFIGILVGLIYLRLEYRTSNIQSFVGVLFFIVSSTSFNNVFQTINTFPKELALYYKEHKKNMYRATPYFITKIMYDIPIGFIMAIILAAILYWMVNLYPTAYAFFMHTFVVFLVGQAAAGYSYIISALGETTDMAMIIAAPLLMPMMLFGGFFISPDVIPDYFIWVEYISWFKYSFEPLLIIQFENAKLICDTIVYCPGGSSNETIPGEIVFIQFGARKVF